MREWCRAFLGGTHLYVLAGAAVDYPPNALVVFAPLALVPQAWLVPVWAAINLSLTPLFAYLVSAWYRRSVETASDTTPTPVNHRVRLQAIATIMLLFLSWGGVRTLLELSRVCLTLAFLAVVVADSRPLTGGICLGLALAKPHIAGPIWLWTAITGRARTAAIALAVAAAGVGVYCVRVGAAPLDVLSSWLGIVRTLYWGTDTFVGRTSVRAWWQAVVPDVAFADGLWIAGAALLLLPPCILARRARSDSDERTRAAVALFCLWSLMTVFHLGNNFILALPAFSLLLASGDAATRALRLTMAAILQFAMMLDIPVHLRHLDPGQGVVSVLIRDFDRIVILATYCCVAFVWGRRGIAEAGAKPKTPLRAVPL